MSSLPEYYHPSYDKLFQVSTLASEFLAALQVALEAAHVVAPGSAESVHFGVLHEVSEDMAEEG